MQIWNADILNRVSEQMIDGGCVRSSNYAKLHVTEIWKMNIQIY